MALRIRNFLTRRKNFLSYFIVWLVAATVGCVLRLYPLTHHASSEASEKASLLVIANIRKTVTLAVERNFPNLPPLEKRRMIRERFDAILKDEKANVRATIDELGRKLDRELPHSRKLPYLQEIDSYYYYSLTDNILRTGSMSPQIRGSKYFNPLMLAPSGYWDPLNLHPYVGAAIHRVLKLFNPNQDLMFSLSFTPLVLMALTLIPFIALCRSLGYPAIVTLTGAINLVLAGIFLKRSLFAWYDDDSYNILFPLLIFALLFPGLARHQKLRTACGLALGCVFSIFVYAFFWQGWVFLESILVGSGVLILLYNHFALRQKDQTWRLFLFFLTIFLGSFLAIGVAFGPNEFFILFKEGLTALRDFLHPTLALWPDLYIAVGELRPATIPFITGLTGGTLSFIIAILGLILQIIRLCKRPSQYPLAFITVIVFGISALFLAFGAERFILLCLPPLSILFVSGLNDICRGIAWGVAQLRLTPGVDRILKPALPWVITTSLIVFLVIYANRTVPGLVTQIYNDTWDQALTKIERETPPDSIVNTWWPPGHFIKAIAKRKVTFDGATINKPQAYWLANVFLDADERAALGLLLMLNNSGNEAADYLTSQGVKLSAAVDLLKEIMSLSRQDAEVRLSGRLAPQLAKNLLALTHKAPPPTYLFLYNDLMDGVIQFSFVGHWDFRKVEELRDDPLRLRNLPHKGSPNYIPFLWQLSGGYPRISPALNPVFQKDNKIVFDQGIQVDLTNKDCLINSPQFGQGKPQHLYYLQGEQLEEKNFPDANLKYSLLLVPQDNSYQCLLMEDFFARSLLMRLYYFKGAGVKYLTPFFETSDMTGRTKILIYKVEWDKFLQDIGETTGYK